jgi:tRNA (guanine-N7-)-methyltransferase
MELPSEMTDPCAFFPDNEGLYKRFVVEIGFGNGERLVNHAILKPDVGFIGCDPFENGVAHILGAIREHGLKNVRIFNGDARFLIEKLRNNSLCHIYVLFPDPWRKRRHHKRRLLSTNFISTLISKITVAGVLVIATDHEDYMVNILENLKEIPNISYCDKIDNLFARPSCQLSTKYEQKASLSGKKNYYLRIHSAMRAFY